MRQLVATGAGEVLLKDMPAPTLDNRPPGAIVRTTHIMIGAGSTLGAVIDRRENPDKSRDDFKISYQVSGIVKETTPGLEGFEPVTERNHPYYSSEINYGPPDPAPLWGAQLEALNIEAQQRFDLGFQQLGEDRQTAILDRQLPANIPADLPFAGSASHVAIGLNAYFYATAEADDLALRAQVHRQTCRGLESGTHRPAPLGD